MRWTIAILSSPGSPALPAAIASVQTEGLKPIVFQEGGRDDWVRSAGRLLRAQPADGVILINDQMRLVPGSIEFLTRAAWPMGCGAITLCCPREYVQRHQVLKDEDILFDLPSLLRAQRAARRHGGTVQSISRRPGLVRVFASPWKQFRALAFPRAELAKLVRRPRVSRDLSAALTAIKRRLYAVHPGLVEQANRPAGFYPPASVPLRDCVDQTGLQVSGYQELAEIIREWAPTLPRDISCVAGIPRSGMTPAAMLALQLHVPLVPIESLMGQTVQPFRPDRSFASFRQIKMGQGKPLIVDDTCSTGASIRELRPLVPGEAYYGAIWARPAGKQYLDFWAAEHAPDHLWQWNWWSIALTETCACDLDGVLCEDWTGNEDRDPGLYQKHLSEARPLFVPKLRLPAIVTSRYERHRQSTTAWLERHGIKYERLIMEPDGSRRRFADYKAEQYANLLAARLFVESSLHQARRIHELTGRNVLSIEQFKFFPGRDGLVAKAA